MTGYGSEVKSPQSLFLSLVGAVAYGLDMEDVVECGRPPNYFATTALKWFCYCQSYSDSLTLAEASFVRPDQK